MVITDDEILQVEETFHGLKDFLSSWFDDWAKANPIGLQSECADDYYYVVRDFVVNMIKSDNDEKLSLEKYSLLQNKYGDDAIMGGLFCKYWALKQNSIESETR